MKTLLLIKYYLVKIGTALFHFTWVFLFILAGIAILTVLAKYLWNFVNLIWQFA